MTDRCESLVCKGLECCDELIRLAEQGMSECDEEDRMIFFGIMLDSAYRLKNAGEVQRQNLNLGGSKIVKIA